MMKQTCPCGATTKLIVLNGHPTHSRVCVPCVAAGQQAARLRSLN